MSAHPRTQTQAPARLRNRSVENHYCSNCMRTVKFERADDLECLACGKRMLDRRRPG